MASSSTSSPAAPARDLASQWPARERHALTGRSQPLDPATNPVRRDLADVRLADRVLAPHYARALPAYARRGTTIHATPASDGAAVAVLAEGAAFRVLEISRDFAWGQAGEDGAVGYVARDALDLDRA